MALEPGTVYEAVRTGVSLGLFTVTQPGQLKNSWIAQGTWQAAGSAPTTKPKHGDEAPKMGDQDEPPRLRHSAAEPATKKDTTPESKTESPAATPAAAAAPAAAPPAQASAPEVQAPEDPDRPRLERGQKAAAQAKRAPAKADSTKPAAKTAVTKPPETQPAKSAAPSQ